MDFHSPSLNVHHSFYDNAPVALVIITVHNLYAVNQFTKSLQLSIDKRMIVTVQNLRLWISHLTKRLFNTRCSGATTICHHSLVLMYSGSSAISLQVPWHEHILRFERCSVNMNWKTERRSWKWFKLNVDT